ncbi:MAG: hypothetical protein AAB968_04775 [Patescibacteria group bacterium]
MLRNIFSCIVLLICVVGYSYAEEKKEATKFDARDFYFYDEANLMQRLILAPKIMVSFLKQLSDEDQIAFLNKFALARHLKDPTQSFRYILEFSPATSEQSLVEILTEINSFDIAEGIPVVLIDNVEAIAQGFVVEPRTPLASEMLGKHLKKIGEFSIRQVAPEGHGWFFIVDGIKPPLHIYPLVNLIHNDVWIKRARPKFQYLHPAIVSRIEVSPISGTIDETRTVTLSIRVFDPEIKVLTHLLPNFGDGKFQPNPIPSLLFFSPTVGTRESLNESSDAHGRIFSLRWRFRLFVPGEWTIPPQTIAYERKGEQLTTVSAHVPFVVTSLIGSLAINDMPSPKLLVQSGKTSDTAPDETRPLFPVYWFDRWISETSPIAKMSFIMCIVLSAVGMGFPIFWGITFLSKIIKKESDIERLILAWQRTCREACGNISLESYRKLETILWDVLSSAFADDLVKKPTLKDVEEQVRRAFDSSHWNSICAVYEVLESSYARDFIPDKIALCETSEKILNLIHYVRHRIASKRR